ncbi:MAG TPA: ATP-binding protein [Allosphingosinicella sp.]|nr:ATP-binding protein [Allosphingosinicella sp.]
MRRFVPKSLIGQIALVMALALLVAQAINFGLVFNERQRATRNQNEGPPIARFVTVAQRIAALPPPRREGELGGRGRRGRFSIDAQSIVAAQDNDEGIAARLRDQAADTGLAIRDARGAVSDEVPLPPRVRERLAPGQRERAEERLRRFQTLRLSIQLEDGRWLNGWLATARPNPWLAARLAGSTLLIYVLLLGAIVLIALRLGRPLKDLTAAAKSFEGRGEAPQVTPRGPADVRRAILAFNAMSARVSIMLDEKDRMLGAIGHDMRTPLASLRIRAENMEPEAERRKMIATIEEMDAMLEQTLALARAGRATEQVRAVDLHALADALVEEFRTLGQPVEMEPGTRLVAAVQPNLLRRALRNLIENGVRHGGGARVAVRAEGDAIALDVTDEGPGIPEADLERVLEPFVRLEASRNRETGGSGLGLALARSAAQAHGGSLTLANRAEGGLLARILLPAGTIEAA